jgi:hypothetical protein
MAMTLANEPFNHEDWLFEVKWDGYRAIAYCRRGIVSLVLAAFSLRWMIIITGQWNLGAEQL